jgi:cytochrome c553
LISVALAQDAAALRARSLAATCANCHGTDGRAQGGTVPGLAGRDSGLIASMMREFRDGKRPATVMHQLAKGYTDQQIDTLAAYFAAVKN